MNKRLFGVVIWTTPGEKSGGEELYYGNFTKILYRTSYFELSWMESAQTCALWLYLCSKGELSISHCPEVFAIEFRFALM